MAGLITKESIETVRNQARLDDVVSQYVQLRNAGADSLKGLCPFHDERTPSFYVHPAAGYYYCFGCGEKGDVIDFVIAIEHLSFVEAVEYLASKTGATLAYEEGARLRQQSGPSKARLVDAHRVAVAYYEKQLRADTGSAALAYLHGRGFTDTDIATYHIGYSPDSWDSLYGELRKRGFADSEIVAAGLAAQGTRSPYDRFRGRIMWPIYSITGDPIGFGARRLDDSDDGPKYLNTAETPLYRKAHVLYGLNMAKKAIAKERKVVIVEGYTDVMAAHLAGIPYAVATCGTAFGPDHIRIIRRLLGDSQNPAAGVMLSSGNVIGGEVIFTFDGDEAGQKAAMRAFAEDQSFAAQTFVCVAPNGHDPCEVRLAKGDEAVRDLVASRKPLFEFAIRSTLKNVPLNTAEGRAAGLRATAPVVARIRDRVMRHEYTRQLADWLGMEESLVRQAVREARRAPFPAPDGQDSASGGTAPRPGAALPPVAALRDPVEKLERETLSLLLQMPSPARKARMDQLPIHAFVTPVHRSIYEAFLAAGGTDCYLSHFEKAARNAPESEHAAIARQAIRHHIQQVLNQADPSLAAAITQIAVEPLPLDPEAPVDGYALSLNASLVRHGLNRDISACQSELRRTDPSSERYAELSRHILSLQQKKQRWDTTTY